MPPLLQLNAISHAFGGAALFDQASMVIQPRERIGLLGRNGCGKTTLLHLLAGKFSPDSGDVLRAPGLRVGLLSQELPRDTSVSLTDLVMEGCDPLQSKEEQRVAAIASLSRLELEPDMDLALLSGGMQRRALLARALVGNPDLLLLDEPTNHLDIDRIAWLEDLLERRFHGALLFVTHDRTFLRKLAQSILELDRGRLIRYDHGYETFLARRDEEFEAEAQRNRAFDKKLAAEEVWIRKGIKARRTRNEGRVRALEEMRKERRSRREREGQARVQIQEASRSGRKVMEIKNLTFAYENAPIINNFSSLISRGDRIGVIGPNGCGKTTLLRLLLDEKSPLTPQSGHVIRGTGLQTVFFDQRRESLNLEASVADNVSDGRDMLPTATGSKHVLGYLQDFLFTPDRSRTPVRFLSGGERNRLLIARLFTRPANVLVLDEPTNDLDIETLDLLEEQLALFKGTVLLVSHDRDFLDRMVTSSWVFEGPGDVREYVGGYSDWLRQQKMQQTITAESAQTASTKRVRTRKLTNKEHAELKELPDRIHKLEEEQETLHTQLADPAFYTHPGAEVAKTTARNQEIDQLLAQAFERWQELEDLNS